MPHRGRLGLFTQSGSIGIALLSGLHRRGVGPSSFVSAGNRADVSGNDLLQFWQDDPQTDAVLMYLESFGNPRKFTRLARRTAAAKPVVVVKGALHTGSVPAGHSVPVTRIPDSTVSALFRQAGVIRVDTVTELLDAGLFLALQPLPAGDRVAVLGNSESLGLLTYDAALTAGLRPHPPLDLTTAAAPEDFAAALARALADPGSDAVVVTAIPRVGADRPARRAERPRRAAPAPSRRPPARGRRTRARPGRRPSPRGAAGTPAGLARRAPVTTPRSPPRCAGPRTARASPWSSSTSRSTPWPTGSARPAARAPVSPPTGRPTGRCARSPRPPRTPRWRAASAEPGRVPGAGRRPGGGAPPRTYEGCCPPVPTAVALSEEDTATLLGRYGIRVRRALPAPDAEAAVPAAAALGYPVALKTTAPRLRHRADLGGVRLDLADEADLRRAYGELTGRLGAAGELLPVVQAMAPRGVDTVVRAGVDPAAGAVLSFGLAGAPSELLGDVAHRLIPATDRDVAELVRSIRAAPLLFGWRGAEPVDIAALEDLLLRVSRARGRPARGGRGRPGARRGRRPRPGRARRGRPAGPTAGPHRPRPACASS